VAEIVMTGTFGIVFTACEMTNPPPAVRMSYGLNGHLYSPWFDGTPQGRRSRYIDVFNRQDLDNTPLLLDSSAPTGSLTMDREPPPDQEPGGGVCIDRHQGNINVLFLDCSVRRVGLKGLWTLKWSGDFNTSGPWTKAGGVRPEDWPQWMRKFKDY
jgi:prepilin-type processing-associated H-X9-DG protein